MSNANVRGTHHFPAVKQATTQVRKGRAANIVGKEVDLWCAAGLGYTVSHQQRRKKRQ